MEFDFIVVGAGSSGCALAYALGQQAIGSIAVLEAGPSDAVPQVKIPFGMLYTMGSRRDWRYQSSPQVNAANRRYKIPRGLMTGGSSSINSMVWFRGRADDYDNWQLDSWRWADVAPVFNQIEGRISPRRLADPHPLSEAFGRSIKGDAADPPTPETESAGVFHTNMRRGRRWSAADAFLRPALQKRWCSLIKHATVNRIEFDNGIARTVLLNDGRALTARRGIVLSAGSIGTPAILMRSGIGPGEHLKSLDIDVVNNLPGVGQNLHDHPSIGVHHAGPNSGYGLTLNQAVHWIISPLRWLARRDGVLSSNFVEAGAFFKSEYALASGEDKPDCQVHFFPFMMGYQGHRITWGSGYFADVCVCRPYSRGSLQLNSSDFRVAPAIDPGILTDDRDLITLIAGFRKLRQLLAVAPFHHRRAPEVYPGESVQTDEQIAEHICQRSGTAYHPVGTVSMGNADRPLTADLQVRGVGHLWVADASVIPSITSANTNAPSMMIGCRAAEIIKAAV